MHINRFGFNLVAAIYLAPLIIIDIVCNGIYEGAQSDFYFFKAGLDGILIAIAVYYLFQAPTASVANARAKVNDRNDEIVSTAAIGAIEWIYCLILCLYSIANFIWLHAINRSVTGFLAPCTLIWSFLSIAVAALAALHFYHLKSGAIVELQKRITQ
jgi:hypothetical protein